MSSQHSWTTCLLSFIWFSLCGAQGNGTNAFDDDPILQYRPNFTRSLPVQILLTGVVLTLVAVLFIHLVFTVQYHWPLAPVNYILQISGVTTLLISLIATLHVVLEATIEESREWPYMLSYIGVDIPPLATDSEKDTSGWTWVEQATWLAMNATASGLIQITHIHFLTLMYPSRLEARLIYILLGPLAVLSAIMQLMPIHGNTKVITYSDAVRNVCNATLSLLFTASLVIWGCFVNRKRAWRTDGGTAVFGVGALTLAILSTVLNFIYIPTQDQYDWLPGFMWAVVLWQSFLGWWWWVGAGMGIGEIEELLRREEKRQRKRKLRKDKRKEQREKARLVWKGMTGAFTNRGRQGEKSATDEDDEETVILDNSANPAETEESRPSRAESRTARTALNTPSSPSPSSSAFSLAANGSFSARFMNSRAGCFLRRWYGRLRLAHLTAARNQAVEREERINQVYRREEGANASGTGVVGWGLGSFGIRQMEPAPKHERRMSSDDDNDDIGNELPTTTHANSDRQSQIRHRDRAVGNPLSEPEPAADGGRERSSVWWWGPLQRWRLQDATVYS